MSNSESLEVRVWREEERRRDLALLASAAVSDGDPEASQQQREHAAMARRLLALERDAQRMGRDE